MDTLGIWIGLNFLETFLFYYLLFGTVIDRKTLKTKDKWILYFVLIVTSTIISVWVKRSVFFSNFYFGFRKFPCLSKEIDSSYRDRIYV
jgi:hypothetical protein